MAQNRKFGGVLAALLIGRRGWSDIRRSVRRALDAPGVLLALPAALLTVWFGVALGLTFVLGNVAGIEGIGHLAGDAEEVRANLAMLLDADAAASADLPPVPVLVLLGLGGGIMAGLTINGLFAFGEEYGWRGHLWDRLVSHGRRGTIGVVGVLWGLWHAPLILVVGLNYPDRRVEGVLAMVVFTMAASWPLDEVRRATGSAVGAAVLHGGINGSAGVLMLLVGGDRLWAAPTGVLGAVAFLPAGAVAPWWRTRRAKTEMTSEKHE